MNCILSRVFDRLPGPAPTPWRRPGRFAETTLDTTSVNTGHPDNGCQVGKALTMFVMPEFINPQTSMSSVDDGYNGVVIITASAATASSCSARGGIVHPGRHDY